jgi:hypothetical protein
LTGGGDLSTNRTLSLNSASTTSLGLADTSVQPARTITAGTGLTGGGDLSADRTLSLNSTTTASLGLADTSVQPTRQVAAGTGLTGGGDLSTNRTLSIADEGVTTAKLDSAGIAPVVTSINGGPLAGFRNAIINGNFDIWQRGVSQSGAPGLYFFGADRWRSGQDNGTGGTLTVSRQSFTLGQTAVPGEPTFFQRVQLSGSPTGYDFNFTTGLGNYIFHRIEGVRTFAGQQVTVSFWMKANASRTVQVYLSQRFGTGGSPSVGVQGLEQQFTATTAWQKFTFTVTMPSISGKTLGTNGDDHLELGFVTNPNQTWTIDLAQVQVEAGPVATPFERRPIGTELALCQRYFVLMNGASDTFFEVIGHARQINSTSVTGSINLPVTMRAVPTRVGDVYLQGNGLFQGDRLFVPRIWRGSSLCGDIVTTIDFGAAQNMAIGTEASLLTFAAEL